MRGRARFVTRRVKCLYESARAAVVFVKLADCVRSPILQSKTFTKVPLSAKLVRAISMHGSHASCSFPSALA